MSKQAEWAPHRRALVDSAAYFAIVERRDANHRAAQMVAHGLADRHWRVYTTNFVVAEAHALILVRSGRALAARFLSEIGESRATVVVRAREVDERRAREIIDRYDDKDFSLTDAISFAVMERLRISFVFTFDQHFAQYGWTVLSTAQF